MPITLPIGDLDQPITPFVRRDFPALRQDMTVEQALAEIRTRGLGERIVYFYVQDEAGRLAGVLPTRRLLTAGPDTRLADVMVRRVIAIPDTATVLEACEFFVMHRYLAFPVLDEDRRVVGLIDVNLFTQEVFDLADVAERDQAETVFEALGFRLAQVRDASPARAFRFRFPWLLITVGSGSLCALLSGAYEQTLARSLVLTFFLAMVLGLGESVSIQSMTVTIQALRTARPTWRWYARALRREAGTAALLGAGASTAVAVVVGLWRRDGPAAGVVALGGLGAVLSACLVGLSVPALLHALRLDPKIAAGPITLALTDLCTLLCYFTLAAVLL